MTPNGLIVLTNNSIAPPFRPTVIAFDSFVARSGVRAAIDAAADELLPAISSDRPLAFTELRLDDLGVPPPEGIGTIRIAVFHPGCETGIERHPNSTQFLYSVRGTGETRVLRGDRWETDCYGEISDAALLEERWHVVEKGVWHHSVARGTEPWILAALHTAGRVEDEYQR